MKNAIYLVTGAAGFLGSNICAQLLERGEKVRAFVLEGDKAAKYIPQEVEIFYGNLCDKASLEPFFTLPEGATSICIHVASMVTVNPYYCKTVLDVNVGGTENIVDMCLEHKECEKLVYVGSTGGIPELPHGEKIKEVKEVDLDKVKGWYSKSKAMATNNVYTAIKKRGLKACVVYPTGIFGPNDYAISETTSLAAKRLLPSLRLSRARCLSALTAHSIWSMFVILPQDVSQLPTRAELARGIFSVMRLYASRR